MKQVAEPKTLQEAIIYFADADRCLDYLALRRWPDGMPVCPVCGRKDAKFLASQRKWQCKSVHHHRQFSIKIGTIFEDSPIPLEKWLPAVWVIVNCKNGISSYEVARDLGVTQKTAWFMLHRIRKAMQNSSFMKMGGGGGEVEVDETFIGGKARNMHKSKRLKMKVREDNWGKTIVMGMLERGGRVMAKVVPDRKKPAIHSTIAETIESGTQLYTDDHTGYMDMSPEYVHSIVNHAEQYVNGRVHTNGIENFWSCLKRGLNGTYVSVEPFHLDRYVNEQVFRFNLRHKHTDAARFKAVLKDVVGRRLTYAELTGRTASAAF